MKTVTKVLLGILGIFMIVAGATCLFKPVYTSLTVGYALGFVMLFDALGDLLNWGSGKKEGKSGGWMLAGAILSGVFGILLLSSVVGRGIVDIVIIYYFAVWLLLRGVLAAINAFRFRRMYKAHLTETLGRYWYVRLILGILIAASGLICMLRPIIMASAIGIMIGIGIMIAGMYMISTAFAPDAE